jgi:hypothetical protein
MGPSPRNLCYEVLRQAWLEEPPLQEPCKIDLVPTSLLEKLKTKKKDGTPALPSSGWSERSSIRSRRPTGDKEKR